MRNAVAERREEQIARVGRHGPLRRERVCFRIKEEDRPGLGVRRGFAGEPAVRTVGGGHTVEGVAVLAVVLEAAVIHVQHGHVEPASGGGEHAVALFIFPEREGRGGKIEEKIRLVRSEQVHGMDRVIFIPAVLAEKDARSERPALHGEIEWAEELTQREAVLCGSRGGAGEVAPVVELAVIGEKRLDRVGTAAAPGVRKRPSAAAKAALYFRTRPSSWMRVQSTAQLPRG